MDGLSLQCAFLTEGLSLRLTSFWYEDRNCWKKISIQTHFLEKREKRCTYRISTHSTRDSTGKVGAEIANCKTFFKLQLFSFWYNTNILRQCNLVFELVWCGVYKRLEIYHWQNSWCNFWKWEASTYHFKQKSFGPKNSSQEKIMVIR